MVLGEGVLLYPSVKLSAGRDDNVRAAETGALSATVTTLAPNLRLETQQRNSTYALIYDGAYTRYSGLNTDNTNNHDLKLTGAHEFSVRSRLNWSLGFQDRFDARADAAVPSTEPDNWRGSNLNSLYTFGAKGAQGRIEAELNLSRKRYQNNLATTVGSDLDTRQLAGRYFWRVMPSTYLVAEARAAVNDYRVGTANNNTDTRLLLGVTWEATAKTTGSFKLGQQRKDFDQVGKGDVSKSTYEASVTWSPLTYSVFTLTASRAAEDALSNGDYNQSRNLGLNWAHRWNSSLSSRVALTDAQANYFNSPRRDDTISASLGLSYDLSRRHSLGLDLVRTERDSTLSPNSYKRNTVFLSLRSAL